MSEIDLTPIVEYFRKHLREHGTGARGMDWKDRDSQYLRFQVISKYIDASSRVSVLDVGCGSGEFLAFALENNIDIDYSGIDICPDMVDACRQRFGGASTTCEDATDICERGNKYDYVIASGTFNAKMDIPETMWESHFRKSILAMFEMCHVALVFNVMTSFVDYEYDRLYYPNWEDLSKFVVDELSRRFIIDHSYPLYEMTMVVLR